MKKLLIVSLFLLSMIGLFAQGQPYGLVFNIRTADGVGLHEADTFGFKAIETHSIYGELWGNMGGNHMYWNWPNEADFNTTAPAAVIYDPTNGQFFIQMAPMSQWGTVYPPFQGGGYMSANFYFIDSEGNELGPIAVDKTGADQQTHPDLISWGGPTGPTAPDAWATIGTPADAAMDVAIDAQLTWSYEGTVAVDGFSVTFNGGEAMDVASDVFTYNPGALAYSTTYTWSVAPYVGDHVYTEGDAPVWSFTTEAAPVVYPTWAANATPVDGATDVALMPTLTWTYDGPAVDGYEIWVGGVDMGDVTEGMSYTIEESLALDYNTMYEWGVKPYINNVAKGLKSRIQQRRYPQEGTMPMSSFTTTNQIPVGGVVITVPAGVTNPAAPVVNPNPEIPGIPVIPAGLEYIAVGVNQPTGGLYGITFTLGGPYGAMRVLVNGVPWLLDAPDVDGQYYQLNGLEVTVWILFAGGAKENKDIVIVDDSTLPVELSSFTAAAHASEYVTLKWVTESESNLHGYNVYRSETENQDQAIRINPSVLAANNTTQTSTYTYTDSEVESTTYYYWLEVSELSNENSFHGPIVVTVEDEPVVPGVTETTFRNFGPSPFTDATSTTLRVKEGETASVTIYNLLGQVVRRESFNAGEHNFTFNGRDLNNKKVANGIYFVKMTSPTASKSFKIVKIK